MSAAVAAKAAETAIHDTDIIDRAMQGLLEKAYRTQINKDEVARVAIESLTEEPANAASEPPSDQFMTHFEKYAGDATEAELRVMFGRLLASEVRVPGSVSHQTLHVVSMLDSAVAGLIVRVLPFCSENMAFMDAIKPPLSDPEITELQQQGFWSPQKTVTLEVDDRGLTGMLLPMGKGVGIRCTSSATLTLSIALLSRAGRDLLNVVSPDFQIQAFANLVLSKGAASIFWGNAVTEGDRPLLLEMSDRREYFAT